jgi:hypothetical protein
VVREQLHRHSSAQGRKGGSFGLVATAQDYWRFAQMMLNGGQLDGVRILSPHTVAFMTRDHLGSCWTFDTTGLLVMLELPRCASGNDAEPHSRADLEQSLGPPRQFPDVGHRLPQTADNVRAPLEERLPGRGQHNITCSPPEQPGAEFRLESGDRLTFDFGMLNSRAAAVKLFSTATLSNIRSELRSSTGFVPLWCMSVQQTERTIHRLDA